MNRLTRFILLLLLCPVTVLMHAWVPGVSSLCDTQPVSVKQSEDERPQTIVAASPAPPVAIRTAGEGSVQGWSERLKPQVIRWNFLGTDTQPFLTAGTENPSPLTAAAPSLQLQKVRWQI